MWKFWYNKHTKPQKTIKRNCLYIEGGLFMLAIERQRIILERLAAENSVRVVELSKVFDVTEETVRRDLDKLEKKGLLKKTYGGAVGIDKEKGPEVEEQSFDYRLNQNIASKIKIGKVIGEMLQAGETVMLDSSTTCLQVLKQLDEHKSLTVITNGLETMRLASKLKHISLIGTGGSYREKSISFVGPAAKKNITSYYADKAVISCKGIDKERGIMESSEFEAEIKQSFIAASKEVILAVDSKKIDKTSIHRLASWEVISCIVTDEMLDEEWLKICDSYGIEVVVAK